MVQDAKINELNYYLRKREYYTKLKEGYNLQKECRMEEFRHGYNDIEEELNYNVIRIREEWLQKLGNEIFRINKILVYVIEIINKYDKSGNIVCNTCEIKNRIIKFR